MSELNELNIPAFQRKRSISAKLRATKTKKKTTRKKPRKVITQRPQRDYTNIPLIDRSQSVEDLVNDTQLHQPKSKDFEEMIICGRCEGYFEKIDVGIIKLTKPLREGDQIILVKEKGLFKQTVNEMQINRKNVTLARSGSDIGLKLKAKPQVGTPVYKVID